MFYPIGFTSYANPGSAFLKVNQDGTANLSIGTVDVGQGSTTIMAQIAAEELGIEYRQGNRDGGRYQADAFRPRNRRQPRDLYCRQRRQASRGTGQSRFCSKLPPRTSASARAGLASSQGFIYVSRLSRAKDRHQRRRPKGLHGQGPSRRWASAASTR